MMVVLDLNCVIDSVMSDSIQEIVKSYGWKVEKCFIKYVEFLSFIEVMVVGIVVVFVFICFIIRREFKGFFVGDKVMIIEEVEIVIYILESQEEFGVFCIKLLLYLKGIQFGKEKDQFGWCFKVEQKDGKVEGVQVVVNGDVMLLVDQME